MVRISFLICAALYVQGKGDAQQFLKSLGIESYSMSWTSVSQGAGGQAVQETHGFSRNGEATQEIHSVFAQDSTGAMQGSKDEVRCVGSHCAERLMVVAPPVQNVQLRGGEAPCHKKHVAAMAAQAAQMEAAQVGAAADGGVPAMLPDTPLTADKFDAPFLQLVALAAFAAAAFGACLGVAALRTGKAENKLQTLQQFLLPGGDNSAVAQRPTAQDDLHCALRDLENNAVEAYVFGLYVRGADNADIANTNSQARAYVQQVCERACLA